MTRPRKPEAIIADDRNRQTDAYGPEDFQVLDSQDIENLQPFIRDADDPRAAIGALQFAASRCRMAMKDGGIREGERKVVFEELARRASALHEFVDGAYHFKKTGTLGCADTFYADLVQAKTADDFLNDPLIKHRRLLGELLSEIENRAAAAAESIDPAGYIHNMPLHALAHELIKAARAGVLPLTPSASRTSRIAALFEYIAETVGISPGDPAVYLQSK